MSSSVQSTSVLIRGLQGGQPQAMADVMARYRQRLARMVRLRLDRRLQGRVSASAILDQAEAEIRKQFSTYLAQPAMPLYLWLRSVTGQCLERVHQETLGTFQGDAGQEVSLYRGALPEANSVSLAAQLLGRIVPACPEADHAEKQVRVQEALNSMDSLDREILALRNFEELNNDEAAAVLGIAPAQASTRFIRALKRLKDQLSRIPGLLNP